MTKQEMQNFEKQLLERGYKKWTYALYSTEDHDVSRVIRDDNGKDMYQIIFRFWDWTKYGNRVPYEASVDLVIMPCFDGRADLMLSACGDAIQLDINRCEKLAEDYYKFIMGRIK